MNERNELFNEFDNGAFCDFGRDNPPQSIRGGIFPTIGGSKPAGMPVCVGFDYLKIACKKVSTEMGQNLFLFQAKDEVKEGKFFKHIQDFETTFGGSPDYFATVEAEARLETISRDWVFVRICNKWLYLEDLNHVLKCFLGEMGLEFHHITRVDVYSDFQRPFMNLEPDKFCVDVYSGKLRKYGTGHIEAHRDKDPHAVTFGRLKSGFQIQFYNKALELKVKMHKPHVFDNWIRAGMDMEKPVFRLEFRLSQSDMKVSHKDFNFDWHSLEGVYLNNAPVVFKLLHDKYFKFKKKRKGIKKREHWNDWYFTKWDKMTVDAEGFKYKKYVNTPVSGKRYIKNLFEDVYQYESGTVEKIQLMKHIERKLEEYCLTSWFESEYGMFINEVIEIEESIYSKKNVVIPEKPKPREVAKQIILSL